MTEKRKKILLFYKLCGRNARKVCIGTGIIGTPVHEIGHAFFCVIFGHKITRISLFQPNSADGTLGFVEHKYNRKNLYHQIGRFFIGTGPIILGSAVLVGLSFLFVPTMTRGLFGIIGEVNIFQASSAFGATFETIGELFTRFFSVSSISNPLWWVFMVLACLIAIHMRLSIPDIKGSVAGLIFIVIVFLLINIIVGLISMSALNSVTNAILSVSIYVIFFLALAIMFSLIMVAIAGIVKGIATAARRGR